MQRVSICFGYVNNSVTFYHKVRQFFNFNLDLLFRSNTSLPASINVLNSFFFALMCWQTVAEGPLFQGFKSNFNKYVYCKLQGNDFDNKESVIHVFKKPAIFFWWGWSPKNSTHMLLLQPLWHISKSFPTHWQNQHKKSGVKWRNWLT